jgi:hypothetical protein
MVVLNDEGVRATVVGVWVWTDGVVALALV